MEDWIEDGNGNKCSIEYWGSEESAEDALATLVNCNNCIDCIDCTNCNDCIKCSDCIDCSNCSNCHGCNKCKTCSDSLKCKDCSDCFRCNYCNNCNRCGYCGDYRDRSDRDNKHNLTANIDNILSAPVVDNLLEKLQTAIASEDFDMAAWGHPCGSPMCLAGHIVHAAGEAGLKFKVTSYWDFTATQIAKASGLYIPMTAFYETNQQARDRVANLEYSKGWIK